LLVLAGVHMKYFMSDEIVPVRKPLEDFPKEIAGWKMASNHILRTDILDILRVDDYLMRDYRNSDGTELSLYIGYYKTHRRSAEIHTPEHCQAGGGWEILSEKKRTIQLSGGEKKIHFIESVYEKDKEKMIFIYWYYVNGRYITNFFRYKLYVILNSLINHRSDASFIRIAVPVSLDQINGAIETGEKFLIDVIPDIDRYI
jgi:EpsI family protein